MQIELAENLTLENMFMIIHIREFGKIETADIDLGNLVLFVGENNSGKTYIMELIYGLFSFFYSPEFASFLAGYKKISIEGNTAEIKAEDIDFYKSFQEAINVFIDVNKENIIKNTFHTQSLHIASLFIEFSDISSDYALTVDNADEYIKNQELSKIYSILKDNEPIFRMTFRKNYPEEFVTATIKREFLLVVLSSLIGLNLTRQNRLDNKYPFIYLPASRSGMMLLYADYLSNDKTIEAQESFEIENEEDHITDNEYGLTEPVYRFLMFLLQYKNSDISSDYNRELLTFIDKNIINGHLEKIGNTMRYKPLETDQSIPIYLSSSLVSEIAPIYQVLSGVRRFKYIMYDEIETCQHPTKQIQLARLLVRMVNSGYNMIVSTHSDTMATAVNNLVTLSFKENKSLIATKLGYELEDILKSANVKAYQFEIVSESRTIVREVPSHFSVGVGFDFDLFNVSNDKIFQDAVALSEEE